MKQSLTELEMKDYICVTQNDMKLTQLMDIVIEKADHLYVYRRLLHLMEEPVIVKWAKENIEIDYVKVSYLEDNREEIIKSDRKSVV